jgi:hypothetical protein
MLIVRLGENLDKRVNFDQNLPKNYIEIKYNNLFDALDYVNPDMFGDIKNIRIYDFDEEDVRSFFYKYIDIFAKSTNVFFIDELSLNKATEDKLIREINKYQGLLYDARMSKEELKKIKDENDNPFFFIDYFMQGNKEQAWKELMRIKDKGFAEHEILGAFMWKTNFVKDTKTLTKLMYIISDSRVEKSNINIYNELEKMCLSL